MDNEDAIKEVAEELQKFQMQLPLRQYTYKQLQQQIGIRINYLITNNFFTSHLHFISFGYFRETAQATFKTVKPNNGRRYYCGNDNRKAVAKNCIKKSF